MYLYLPVDSSDDATLLNVNVNSLTLPFATTHNRARIADRGMNESCFKFQGYTFQDDRQKLTSSVVRVVELLSMLSMGGADARSAFGLS